MPTRFSAIRSWGSRRSLVVVGSLAVAASLTLTACGGSSAKASSAQPSASSSAAPQSSGPAGAGARRGPAASGTIAAVTGTTMQVQNQTSGQVAVSWTASTTFTQQATVAASSIAAGDCVTVIAASGTASTATTFTAATVAVTKPTNGSCDAGFGAGGTRTRPSGEPTGARPSGSRTFTRPSGAAGAQTAFASGSVVSVAGSTLVVASRTFNAGASSGSTAATTNKTITLASTSTITEDESATATAVVVGKCASAEGTADSSGAVTATSIAITDPVNGACTGGFGGFGGRGGAGGASTGATG